MAMLDEHHPVDDHRFLWFLGVTPQRQGQGLGSSLLASTLERCDREGVAAYLDATSEHNRRLYERHGFTVVAERSVDGSPPLWAMWRDPR
jgi:ribosomal protein S18 acetylase RimI-like enzyme